MNNPSDRFDHHTAEVALRKHWQEIHLDEVDTGSKSTPKPFYNLMMFPYPSAEGLHVGNMYAFTGSDIYGRFKRHQGYSVLEPIGLDGFGIHSENYALKVGRHPMDHATITQKNFYVQLHKIGAMFDWTKALETYDPDYYRSTQWLFVQMFKHGLAFREKALVNWCPSDKTVLADEQVIDGCCERCGNTVVKKPLEQWFFRITAYAEKLLENLPKLDWSEKVKIAQEQWIGKKEGINIRYQVQGLDEYITVFTTAPVNFGMTFLVVSPEYELVQKILQKKIQIPIDRYSEVSKYVEECLKKSEQERKANGKEKTGAFTGLYVINPMTNQAVPVWVSDFVVKGVGTGAVQGCPGHDYKDFEFAKKFGLPIKRVVIGTDGDISEIDSIDKVIASSMKGKMVNSKFLNGMEFAAGLQKTMDYFEEKGWGKRVSTYHLRDWLISRQRYWGPPIPMIFCGACASKHKGERKDMPGWYTVPDNQLPVILPRIEDYKPGDDGIAPLAKHKEFYETTCPGCGGKAVRETDVSDTFLDSSWYFLRYPSITGESVSGQLLPWDPEITKRWLPVHMYTGGAEHSVLHLMYSRFVTMALHDWGYLDFEEPFTHFFAHGLVIKDGAKMSKSKGNVINPDEYLAHYGADALRLYLMFMGPFHQGGDFRDTAMEGTSRWVGRIWRLGVKSIAQLNKGGQSDKAEIERLLHKLVKKVGDDLEKRHYNTAIASMMEFTNAVQDVGGVLSIDALKTFLILLSPFAPYLTEELYQKATGRDTQSFDVADSIHVQLWPTYDQSLVIEEMVEVVIQVNGKVRDKVSLSIDEAQEKEAVIKATQTREKVAAHLDNRAPSHIIFVPGRLINYVV